MNVRAKRYLAVFSFYTAVNIFLLAKLRINGDLRADCTQNYIQSFHIWDFLIFAVFFGVVWTGDMQSVKRSCLIWGGNSFFGRK